MGSLHDMNIPQTVGLNRVEKTMSEAQNENGAQGEPIEKEVAEVFRSEEGKGTSWGGV